MKPHTMLSWVAIVALSVGCSKKSDDKEAPAGAKVAEAPSGKPDPKTFFTGAKPQPTATLAKVKFGMTEAEAIAAAPELAKKGSSLGTENYAFAVYASSATGKVDRLTASIEMPLAEARKLATAAWGEARDYKYSVASEGTPVWFNPELGVSAKLEKSFDDKSATLEFRRYLPLESFLGNDPKRFGFETKPLLGATVEEIKAEYATYLKEQTKEEAEAERKRLEAFAGKDLSALGDAKASLELNFPPIETDDFRTTVWLDFEGGKLIRFRFPLSYESHPAAKDEIRARLDKQLGTPKEGKDLGDAIWTYSDAPHIYLKDDTISENWDVTVEAPAKK